MPYSYMLRFGTYDLPSTLRPEGRNVSQDTAPVARPRTPGSETQVGRREPVNLTIRGELTADTAEALMDLENEVLRELSNGKLPLFFGRSDRYYKSVQIKSFTVSSREGLTWGVVHSVSIVMEAADFPYEVDCSDNEDTHTGASDTINNLSNAYVKPVYTLVVGSGGTGPITIANTTTGETMTVGNSSDSIGGGGVIVISRDGYTVTVDGVPDFSLVDGVIPQLAPGNNTITKAAGGSATISSLTISYQRVYA